MCAARIGELRPIIYPGVDIWDKDNPNIGHLLAFVLRHPSMSQRLGKGVRGSEYCSAFERWILEGIRPGASMPSIGALGCTDSIELISQVPGLHGDPRIENGCGVDSLHQHRSAQPIAAELAGPRVCQGQSRLKPPQRRRIGLMGLYGTGEFPF